MAEILPVAKLYIKMAVLLQLSQLSLIFRPVLLPIWKAKSELRLKYRSFFVACPHEVQHLSHFNVSCQQTLIFPMFGYACRHYAKGKDKKKDNKNKAVVINENFLSQAIDVTDLQKNLNRVMDKMKDEYVKNFTLRTSLGALDTLPVVFEEKEYTLPDLAQIGRKSPKMYVVDLSSFPQVIPDVLKAIAASGLGLNPQQDGTTLFIPVPKITTEYRETLIKNSKGVFVKAKDQLREVQNKFVKSIKNKQGLADDLVFAAKEQITAITDQKIAEAEAMLKKKQEELKG